MNLTVDTVRAAFAFHPLMFKAIPEAKGAPGPTKALADILAKRMGELVPEATRWATSQVAKADQAPKFDFSDLLDEIAQAMADAALASVSDIEGALGVSLDSTPEVAIAWAQNRAAEMIGKKIIAGVLTDNPDARWVISDALRKTVQDKVAEAIANGWSHQQLGAEIREAFGFARAEMIARTEIHLVYGHSAAEGYREMGVAYVRIVDGPGCLPDRHDDKAEAGGEPVAGVIDFDAPADGQVWSVDQYQEHLIAHPNCVRGAVPWEGKAA